MQKPEPKKRSRSPSANSQQTPKLVVGLRPSIANITGNNPKDRYGLAKVPFSLIPESSQVFMAMGLKHGARKYGPFNWRVEPVQGRVYLEAAKRHLSLLLDGEDFDRDTGIHHGAFILSTVAIYLDAMVQGTLIDNRSLRGRTGDLVAFFNEQPGQELTRAEYVAGFRKLVPHGEQLFDSLEEGLRYTSRPGCTYKPRKRPTTMKTSAKRRSKDLEQVKKSIRSGVHNARR